MPGVGRGGNVLPWQGELDAPMPDMFTTCMPLAVPPDPDAAIRKGWQLRPLSCWALQILHQFGDGFVEQTIQCALARDIGEEPVGPIAAGQAVLMMFQSRRRSSSMRSGRGAPAERLP